MRNFVIHPLLHSRLLLCQLRWRRSRRSFRLRPGVFDLLRAHQPLTETAAQTAMAMELATILMLMMMVMELMMMLI